MAQVTIKTSTIFIAKGNRTQVFHSVSQIPPDLRKQLEETTNSFNSATILIADRRGKQEILKALEGLPSNLRNRLAASMNPARPVIHIAPFPMRAMRFFRNRWVEICLPLLTAIAVWGALNLR